VSAATLIAELRQRGVFLFRRGGEPVVPLLVVPLDAIVPSSFRGRAFADALRFLVSPEVKAAGDLREGRPTKEKLSSPTTVSPTLSEYRLGEMLKEAKAAGDMRKGAREPGWKGKHGESASDATRSSPSTALPSPTLADLGVSKNLSSRATLPKEHIQ
jgi:hypothetical protein